MSKEKPEKDKINLQSKRNKRSKRRVLSKYLSAGDQEESFIKPKSKQEILKEMDTPLAKFHSKQEILKEMDTSLTKFHSKRKIPEKAPIDVFGDILGLSQTGTDEKSGNEKNSLEELVSAVVTEELKQKESEELLKKRKGQHKFDLIPKKMRPDTKNTH